MADWVEDAKGTVQNAFGAVVKGVENIVKATTPSAPVTVPEMLKDVDNRVRTLANDLTFGGADWLAGAADTVIHGGNLADNVQTERAKSDQAKSDVDALWNRVTTGNAEIRAEQPAKNSMLPPAPKPPGM